MADRQRMADEKYRRMFYELGLDKSWTFIGFEKKDRLWFRCDKCGTVSSRGNDIFKGRQNKLLCRVCNNGKTTYSPEADAVLKYYQSGHSIKETSVKFGVSVEQVKGWAKIRRVTNGRTFEQGGQESNKARADAAVIPGRVSRNASYYKRAKLHGAEAEIGITLQKLIKRDGLTCAICGLQCIEGGDYLSDLYPTIDHIVPISRGGGHTWRNVQVAHRRCNLNKSNRVGEEWNNAD